MDKLFDMIIVGGGPGGYTAALYAARAGMDVLVLERLSAEREEVLGSNLFGKTVWDLVSDGLHGKLSGTDPQTLEKFRQSLTRILSEGAQGLICIIL